MRRPMYVQQDENHFAQSRPTFWYVVKSPNGKVMATSEVFFSRANAIRAARAFIRYLDPEVNGDFTYWTGQVGQMKRKAETW